MVIYRPKNINQLPVEILEKTLLCLPYNNHYILKNVCRKWYHIIQEWRIRNKKQNI